MQTVVSNRNHITGILGLHNTAPSSSVLSKALRTLGGEKSRNLFIFSQGSGYKLPDNTLSGVGLEEAVIDLVKSRQQPC